MRAHQPHHIIIRPLPKILCHLNNSTVGSRKADQKGKGFLILPGRQIVAVDALAGRALQAQGGEFKYRRLCQYVADARAIEIDTLCSLKYAVDPVHNILV